jgi:acyl-coenzyme A synthetase/AMP-(fatty) acid ligase
MAASDPSPVAAVVDAATIHDALLAPGVSWPFIDRRGRPSGDRSLAFALLQQCTARGCGGNDTLCVVSRERSLLGAAILASLAGGPRLLLPASFSKTAIAAACASLSTKIILASEVHSMPEGFQIISADDLGRETTSSALTLSRALDDTLLYLYTGGSTGRPVLWSKSIRNLFGEVAFHTERFQITPGDVIVAAVPPFHIYGLLFSVLLPMLARASALDETPFFPNEIVSALLWLKATMFVAGPMQYQALSEKDFSPEKLRLALSSGGFLEESYDKSFFQSTGVGVTEVYGSTETGGIAFRCRQAGEQAWYPFSLVRWRVGTEDRLAVNSPFLSRDLARDAEGWYLTGDRVLALPTGGFELLGRIDGIVKVGGKRVDLAEVESALKALPRVTDVFVLAVAAPETRENILVALVVSGLPAEQLNRLLQTRLDAVAVPRRIVCVPQIPTTAAGKRDRAAALELLGYPQQQ